MYGDQSSHSLAEAVCTLANGLQSVQDAPDSSALLARLLPILAGVPVPHWVPHRLVVQSLLSTFLSRLADGLDAERRRPVNALTRLAAAGRLEELRLCARQLALERGPLSQSGIVRSALSVIDTQFRRRDISLRIVSTELHVSTGHLSRKLNSETGATFYDHLRQRRVQEAQRLLASSRLSIKEIAAAAGFAHCGQLDRHFSMVFDCTPSNFRRFERVLGRWNQMSEKGGRRGSRKEHAAVRDRTP